MVDVEFTAAAVFNIATDLFDYDWRWRQSERDGQLAKKRQQEEAKCQQVTPEEDDCSLFEENS